MGCVEERGVGVIYDNKRMSARAKFIIGGIVRPGMILMDWMLQALTKTYM